MSATALQATPPTSTALAQLACRDLLESLIQANAGVLAGVIGTADGRIFAHAHQQGQHIDPPRVAAIATSLLALSESFSKEALRSPAQYNSIATPHGTIVVVRVPTHARGHVLCLWADKTETFAMTLRFALDSATQAAVLIDKNY